MADGRAVVARDVVFVAQDGRHGLVLDCLVHEQHVVGFLSLGTLAAADEVDGAAQHLGAFAGQHAVCVEVARGFAPVMAQHVVKVELLFAVTQIVRGYIGGGALAAQIAGKPRVGVACAEHGLEYLDGGAVA